jgi:hypothetical protein
LGGLCETEGSPGRSLLASECGVGMWRAPYRRAMPHLILVESDVTCQDGCAALGGVGPQAGLRCPDSKKMRPQPPGWGTLGPKVSPPCACAGRRILLKRLHPPAVPIGACSNSGLTSVLVCAGAGRAGLYCSRCVRRTCIRTCGYSFRYADRVSGGPARLGIAALAPAIFSRLFACGLIAAEKVHGSPLHGESLSYKVNTRSAPKLFRRL